MPPVKATRRANPKRNPRRRVSSRGLKVAVRWGLPVILFSAVIAGSAWLIASGEATRIAVTAKADALHFSARVGLRVDHVLVTGRHRVTRAMLERALAVRRGMPILGFDPHAAKVRIETIPWVRSAIVERRFPDTIYVRIAERQPLALWQHGGRVSLIDAQGVVITPRRLSRYHWLPLVVGADAPPHAAAIIEAVRNYPALDAGIHALVRVSGRRWDIRFENGVTARLPEKGAGLAMATLARLIERDRLFERDVVMIDLRFKDRLVVRTKARKAGGSSRPKTKPRNGKGTSEST